MRIFGEDYFLPQTANKLLHFFIPDSNELQVLRVE